MWRRLAPEWILTAKIRPRHRAVDHRHAAGVRIIGARQDTAVHETHARGTKPPRRHRGAFRARSLPASGSGAPSIRQSVDGAGPGGTRSPRRPHARREVSREAGREAIRCARLFEIWAAGRIPPAPLVCGRGTRVTGSGTDPIGPDPTRSDLPASKLIDVNDGRRPQGPGASPDGPSGLARQDSMTRTDEELVARSIGGDVDSFNQLVLRWERPIYALAYRVIGREEEARDVVQETFLRAFRGIKNFRGQAKFSSWVYRIALNLCRDWIRRERRAPIQAAPEGVDLVELAAEQGPVESIETLVARNDMSQAVAVAMARLPEEQRTAIILKEYHGMTFQEIADLQGCPLSTVKTRLYQGLSVLRRHLQQQGKYDPTTTTVP